MLQSSKELTNVPAGPGPDSDTVPGALWLKPIHHPFEVKGCLICSVQRMCAHTRTHDWMHVVLALCALCEPKEAESRTPSKKRKLEAGPGFSIAIGERDSNLTILLAVLACMILLSPQLPKLHLRGSQSSILTPAGAKPICSVMGNLSASAVGIKARC